MQLKFLGKRTGSPADYAKGQLNVASIFSFFDIHSEAYQHMSIKLFGDEEGTSFYSFLKDFSSIEVDTVNGGYKWRIKGSYRRNYPLIEARDADGTVVDANYPRNLGMNGEKFYLVFGEDCINDGEILHGNLNEAYPLRVLGPARFEGPNAVYMVETINGSTDGVPVERLLLGERFSTSTPLVEEEGSREVGEIRYAKDTEMFNDFTTIRMKHKEYGNSRNIKNMGYMSYGFEAPMYDASGNPIKDANGNIKTKTTEMWIDYVSYLFEKQFQEGRNKTLIYGRSNRDANGEFQNIGKSGNVIKSGAGLFEQLEYGNVVYYNKFTLDLLERIIMDLPIYTLPENERTLVMLTGQRGAYQFHKAILSNASGWTFASDNNAAIITKTTSPLHTNALSAGFQFTEYKAPNGIIIKVKTDPLYDDPVQNKIDHPMGGKAMSYRYDILNIGSTTTPNIQLIKPKDDYENRGVQAGLRNPFNRQPNNPYMSFDEDAGIQHIQSTFGIVVHDPTRCVTLKPAILED